MPLKSGACRFAVTPLSAHVWISDDILNHAWHRWARSSVGQRYGSAIPGPLEARKRSMKRRMTEFRSTGGGVDLHPGFLAGLNQGQDNQQDWQWQPPTTPLFNGLPIADKSDDVALPPWLIDHCLPEEESPPIGKTSNPILDNNADIEKPVIASLSKAEPERRSRQNPVNQLAHTTDLDIMRRILSKVRQEKYALRRKCSIVAFENLVSSGCEIDRILEFLGDRTLNQRGARNLTFFVAYCLEASKVEEMRIFCKWVARQLYVGRYSDSALLLILQSLFNIRERFEWQGVLDEYCEDVVQALHSSPVVRTEYLKLRTWSSFVGILFHDVHSERMLGIGLKFVKASSAVQLDHLTERIWPLIEHWTRSWEPSRSTEFSPISLASSTTALLQSLPQDKLCETVTAVSWRLLGSLSSSQDLRTEWQRQSIWWSAIRSREIFQYVRKSHSWLEIAEALQRRQTEVKVSTAAMEINQHLDQGNMGAAHRTMLQCPQMSFDRCPGLAEALIANSERDVKTALGMLQSRRPLDMIKMRSMSNSKPLKQIRQDRLDLLERLAFAYAQASHIKDSFAFRCVYECWSLQKQDDLGPVRPTMARALIQTGIVRPLQTGRRLVSQARLEWILQRVAEAEGKDTMRKIGIAVWQWRDEVIRQMKTQRNTKRQDVIGQQWQEQSVMRREPGHWDSLRAMASAGKPPSMKHRRPPEHLSLAAKQRVESPSSHVGSRLSIECDIAQNSILPSPYIQVLPFTPQEVEEQEEEEEEEDDDDDIDDDGIDPEGLPWAFHDPDTSVSATSVAPGPTSEKMGYVMHYVSRDTAGKQDMNDRAEQALDAQSRSQTEPSRFSLEATTPTDSHGHEGEQRGQIHHQLGSLLQQLNSAPRIRCVGTFGSCSPPATDFLPELSSITPCSLVAAVDVSSTVADQGQRGSVIRRLVGTGQIHGAREGEEPETLSTALQPPVGTGVGVMLGGSGLEGFGSGTWMS